MSEELAPAQAMKTTDMMSLPLCGFKYPISLSRLGLSFDFSR